MKKTKTKQRFEVKGSMQDGKTKKPFTKHVLASNEQTAMEQTLTVFGSKNKINRRNIWIDEAKPVKEGKT